MSTRILAAAVIAAALSSAITATILQISLATPAGAAIQPSRNLSASKVSELQLTQQTVAANTQRLILVELRAIHRDIKPGLKNINAHLVNLNQRVLNTNTNLARLVKDDDVLLRNAPSILNGPRDAQGLIPQIGYILDDFCINAEVSQYGQNSAPGVRTGC
jgi:hypothetical protein